MDDWFNSIASSSSLPACAAEELRELGFVVIPEIVAKTQLAQLRDAYDAVVLSADPADRNTGSTTTRVQDLVNRGPEFDSLYVNELILGACCSVIGRPFKLSTMLARAVNPCAPAQSLHVDFRREEDGFPMLGFILMLDDFRRDNGSTRFVPGSHHWFTVPDENSQAPSQEGHVLACGPAGSVVVYNGSVWHGHAANKTSEPRRSIQGAYIRRDAVSGTNLPARMRPETMGRISALAKYLLAVA